MTTDAKKLLKLAVFFIFSLFIILYTFFRTKDLVFGVKIREVNIVNGTQMQNGVLTVRGKAEKASGLYLNGREIPIDEKGNFQDALALLSGYNKVVIQAEDKFGHTDQKIYELTF